MTLKILSAITPISSIASEQAGPRIISLVGCDGSVCLMRWYTAGIAEHYCETINCYTFINWRSPHLQLGTYKVQVQCIRWFLNLTVNFTTVVLLEFFAIKENILLHIRECKSEGFSMDTST